jgi:hypothetical protein
MMRGCDGSQRAEGFATICLTGAQPRQPGTRRSVSVCDPGGNCTANARRGGELYSKRQCMVEPVFAQIKANRRIDRFKRRGRAAARSEWRLIAATHNLLTLHRHSMSPAGV